MALSVGYLELKNSDHIKGAFTDINYIKGEFANIDPMKIKIILLI